MNSSGLVEVEVCGLYINRTMPLIITIPYAPIPKGRPRMTRSGRVFTPKRTREWERLAGLAIAAQIGGLNAFDEPLRGECRFIFSRPKNTPKKAPSGRIPKTTRPDLDNLVKALLDAGSQAGLYVDDARVVETLASKWFAAVDEEPHVELTVYQFNE